MKNLFFTELPAQKAKKTIRIESLGSEVKFLSGGTPSKKEKKFWGGQIPWVSSSAMIQKHIWDTEIHVTKEGARNGTRKVPPKTVLVVVRGMSLAKEFRVAITEREVTFNQDLKALIPSEKLIAEYLFYYLLSQNAPIRDSATEAAHGTKKLEMKVLEKWPLPLPSLLNQKKIAAVLSAYDDLIENNQRRIALLEKMAEDIYREWFVRFRFSGHESMTFTKGLPAKWEKVALSKLGNFLNGYAFKPKDWHTDGIPIIKIKEMTNGISDETPKNSGVNINKKYFFDDGDIIFSWSATLLVKLWVHGPGLLNQHLFKVTPLNGIPKSFLYFSIQQSLKIFESLTTGATMKHIRRKELDSVKICLPPENLLIEFDKNISCILNRIIILNKKNRVLEKTRNLLLPRLISGKLSVENLDIQFPPSMQAKEESDTREAAHA